jgi:hypothetical protein
VRKALSLTILIRAVNRPGHIRFESGRLGKFNLLKEIRLDLIGIESDYVGSGSGRVNLHVVCFLRSLIYFDWIEGYLISGRVGSGQIRVELGQFDFFFKNQVRSGSDGSGDFFGLGRVLPPLILLL